MSLVLLLSVALAVPVPASLSFVGPLAADGDDVGAILDELSATAAPCADEIAGLDARVAAAPSDLVARRARGVCLYQLGRLEYAWADLKLGLSMPDAATQDPEPAVVGAILAARRGENAAVVRYLAMASAAHSDRHPQVVRGRIVTRGAGGDLGGAWAALDKALKRSGEHPAVRTAALELIALDPDGATPSARAATTRAVTAVTRHNRAAGWLSAGHPDACVAEAEGALSEADPSDIEQVEALELLAWRCAVAASLVGPATRHLKEMGRARANTLPPGTLIQHVRLVRDAGQPATALKLLSLVQPVSVADHRDVATLRVGLLTALGQLDDAVLAATSDASAVSRANLAKALVADGRTADALVLLSVVCPAMTGRAAADCVRWQGQLQATTP